MAVPATPNPQPRKPCHLTLPVQRSAHPISLFYTWLLWCSCAHDAGNHLEPDRHGMSYYVSELDHWRLEATVHKDYVEEIHCISNAARGIRRQSHVKRWDLGQVLGKGSSGQVQLQTSKDDGKERAVKRISTAGTKLSNAEYEKELRALLEFSKPKYKEAAVFVEFFGWFSNGWDVFLAMEYVPLGDLESNVGKSKKIAEAEVKDISQQILSGLSIMHSESFAHRDLKPQNVLVVHGSPQWWIKLADFGLSKRLTDETGYHTRAGTQSYMAPELLNYLRIDEASGSDYSNLIDIWALGCIVYRLITGVVPFAPCPDLMKYCADKSLFPFDHMFDSGVSSGGANFIRRLLAVSPKERPTAAQALEHQWIGLEKQSQEFRGRAAASDDQSSDVVQSLTVAPRQSDGAIFNNFTTPEGYNTVSHKGLQTSRGLTSAKFVKTIQFPNLLADLDNEVRNMELAVPEPLKISAVSEVPPENRENLILKDRYDLNGLDKDQALISAVKRSDPAAVKTMLAKRANPSTLDDSGVPVTHLAARNGATITFEMLMSAGADFSAIEPNMEGTLLHSAAEGGDIPIADAILADGVDINARDKIGFTALYLAAERENLFMMKYLKNKGADVSTKDNEGLTVLDRSALFGSVEVVQTLLNFGVEDKGRSALKLARGRNRAGIVELLEEHQKKTKPQRSPRQLNRKEPSKTSPPSVPVASNPPREDQKLEPSKRKFGQQLIAVARKMLLPND